MLLITADIYGFCGVMLCQNVIPFEGITYFENFLQPLSFIRYAKYEKGETLNYVDVSWISQIVLSSKVPGYNYESIKNILNVRIVEFVFRDLMYTTNTNHYMEIKELK